MKQRRGCSGMLVVWMAAAFSLWATGALVDGIHIAGFFPEAFFAALVLGFLNAVLRPLLVFLTLPVSFLTIGLFLLFINASMLALAGALSDSLQVDSFADAFIGALVLSLVSGVAGWLSRPRRTVDDQPRDD